MKLPNIISNETHIIMLDTGDVINRKSQRVVGCKDKGGYIVGKVNGKKYRMHRYIYECCHNVTIPSGLVIHHINHIRDDNRISNLEMITSQKNNQSQLIRTDNTSGFKGVCWHKQSKKWQARIKTNYKLKHLGLFNTKEEAYQVYKTKVDELNKLGHMYSY